jgi:hypothetical protein
LNWRNSTNRTPIELIPLDLGDSYWEFSTFFSIVDAAHDWHEKPSFFGICDPKDDPVIMSAYSRSVARMRAIENQEQARKMKKARKRKGGE